MGKREGGTEGGKEGGRRFQDQDQGQHKGVVLRCHKRRVWEGREWKRMIMVMVIQCHAEWSGVGDDDVTNEMKVYGREGEK